ncbi:MAG: protein kinase domain-containing protein, partial [Tepidiformaceae bacterium]
QSMARLAHPNLVVIHDIGEDSGNPFIVQEFMDGGDVASLLASSPPSPAKSGQAGRGDEGIAVARTLAIAKDVCRGLAFIHERGVVHRDLKPANVFIASDGTAKIGDFGLAVALDRSRITQYGMMLGTVAYMPPEQALGGDVTGRSDLYSLGAMLYEMVTGRPPFVGDDPTAVISQHINTPPVGPSWLTEHCPPDLEALILDLLAKVPADRPTSAEAVLAVLERVDPTQKSASHSGSNELSRVARGVFVGRGPELEKLRKAFDEAFAGRGRLVMLVGEPGIGKTRAAQELETYAKMRGAQVLWGRAHEASGAPAYWPWMQAGRQWASTNDLAAIAAEMAQTQGELVRIFPELRNGANFVEPEAVNDPQSAQFRLFDAYVTFVRAMANKSPLVIVLDDLHWADKPTLLLLQHLARELVNLRVLVVGTFRDTDLSRTHPLSEALASLNREAGFQRVVLKGLAKADVAAYIREAANVVPQPGLVDRIYEETEGNPFFLSEVVNLLVQEGAFSKQSISDIAVPDGVKEALGRRLDRISAETNELLQVCAVAGREFSYDTLTLLGDRDEDALLKHIEEALAARVIEEMERPGAYRFTHALMQETLLSELSTTRRVRLHGQVGEALERRRGDRADQYARRLATHFLESSTLTPRHAQKAVRYAKLAAQQADAQTAWDEAAKWYERVLSLVTQSDDGPGEDEAELLMALGVCQQNDLQNRAAFRNLMRAITLYRERNDGAGVARAAVEALSVFMRPERQRLIVHDALAQLGGADPYLEARLLIQLPEFRDGLREIPAEARIREIVNQHHFPEIEGALLARMGQVALYELRLDDGAELLVQAEQKLGGVNSGFYAVGGIAIRYLLPIMTGNIGDGVAAIEEGLANSRKVHARPTEMVLQLRLAGLALVRGDLDQVTQLRAEMHNPIYTNALQLAAQAELEGDIQKAITVLPDVREAGGFPAFVAHIHAGRCRIRYLAGDVEGAKEELRAWAAAIAYYPSGGFSLQRFYPLTELGEALPALADDALAAASFEELQLLSMFRWDPTAARGADAIAGALGLRLGHLDAAEARFRTGLDWATRGRLPVEEGRNLEGLAEVAHVRGNIPEALTLLDRAAAIYRQYGARLYLDRVIAAKVRLQGISGVYRSSIENVAAAVQGERLGVSEQVAADGTVTLLFSDIEGSTATNERLGDARWIELLHAHNTILDGAIQAHGGRTVKTMGDGYMAVFASPEAGVRCALAVQAAFDSPREVLTDVRVRIGVHAGQAVRDQGDFFGREVNYAARVANAAIGGEVVVSSLLRDLLAPGGDFAFDDGREVELKGLAGRHRIHVVSR